MKNKGLLLIVSGPSGAGKGTVVSELVKDTDFALSISATTRKPREGEKDGIHYFFKSEDEFKKMAENGDLLEHACFCGNYYGTPKSYVEKKLEEGKNVILEIEVQGALQVKEKFNDALLIFLAPPNIGELEKRLRNRGTETEEKIQARLARAREEFALTDKYDYIVINEVVDKAAEDIKLITDAEKMRASRNDYDFFK
ncbi:MAG: guanylate kinase, partial [Firmicutes bacterium]|nr:guanylate kinase [Bacillota bacterium]